MKKTLLVLALALIGASACPFQAYAKDKENVENTKNELGITFEVGADAVSSYLWRGYNLGGISFQPFATLNWKGLYISGWGNIGADNFQKADSKSFQSRHLAPQWKRTQDSILATW